MFAMHVGILRSILRISRRRILIEGANEEEQRMANTVATWIQPRELRSEDEACVPCWLRARRTRVVSPNQDVPIVIPIVPDHLEGDHSDLMCAVCGQNLSSPTSDQEWNPDSIACLLEHQQEQSMERWRTATAVVTGANGGVGGAVCVGLANAGITVIAVDVHLDRIPELQADATNGKIIQRHCDITSPKEVTETFKWVNEEFDGVHILVNCAGVLYQGHITDVGSNTLSDDAIITTIDVNLKGMIFCTRHAIASMRQYKIDGHIININSIAGHYIPWADNMNVYATTKHAVTAFTASLNTELAAFKNKIKTTSISPGLVSTSMASYVEQMKMPALQPPDVADAVLYVLSTPPHINISELTITPVMEKRL